MKKKLVLSITVVIALTMVLSATASADIVDGYIWQELDRETKTGVMMGSMQATNFYMEVLGEDSSLQVDEDEARSMTYVMDELYEDHFPLHYNLMEVVFESGEIDL